MKWWIAVPLALALGAVAHELTHSTVKYHETEGTWTWPEFWPFLDECSKRGEYGYPILACVPDSGSKKEDYWTGEGFAYTIEGISTIAYTLVLLSTRKVSA